MVYGFTVFDYLRPGIFDRGALFACLASKKSQKNRPSVRVANTFTKFIFADKNILTNLSMLGCFT